MVRFPLKEMNPDGRRTGENVIRLTAKITANPVNQCGLVAGAIGGESLVLLVLVNIIILKNDLGDGILFSETFVGIWNILFPFFIIALFECWGAFAAWLGTSRLRSRSDAFLTGFIAGIMMGILLEVMWIANMISLISQQLEQYAGFFTGYGNTLLVTTVLLFFVFMGGILSAFGAYITHEIGYLEKKPL